MITTLKIERFKSVRRLELSCRRVNLFIGEPNTGKSNILEALGVLSWVGSAGRSLKEFVRFDLTQNLFYDSLTDEPIQIDCLGQESLALSVRFEQDRFDFAKRTGPTGWQRILSLGYGGEGGSPADPAFKSIKFYRFRPVPKFDSSEPGALTPPEGRNLFAVVYGSRSLREWMAELFRPYGLAVVMKPHERAIELQKHQDGIVTACPYVMASETLQRTVFFHVAMESNQDAVLVFEEPEAHAFPYYIKQLGERIARDQSNQYFIATHNPYLLTAILEKASKDQVAVFATRYRNYATEAALLTEADLSRLLEADPFLGLESVLESG